MKDRLKIGYVLDDGLDKPDGVQQYVLQLGEWMSRAGHEVHYLVGETKRQDIKNLHSMATNIKVSFNGNKLTIPALSSKKKIKKVLAETDFDVLHVQVPYSPMMGARVIAQADKKTAVVGTFHVLPYGWISSVGSSLLGLALRFQNKKFDKVFAVSEPAQKFAKEKYKISSNIIPNFVDTSRYKSGGNKPGKKPLNLIFVGRLVARKGCGNLLKALSRAIESGEIDKTDVHLDICGGGSEKDELEKFCRDKSLDNVQFHGFVSEEEKVHLLSKADVAVYPAFGGESFGIVLLEAMASGCSVIGGDNPGYRSVLSNTPEALFDPADIPAFADILAKIINDREFREATRGKQQRLLAGFDMNNVADRVQKEYFGAKHARLNSKSTGV
jgi:phosphatidylinositol alpha-mannosyltransferase